MRSCKSNKCLCIHPACGQTSDSIPEKPRRTRGRCYKKSSPSPQHIDKPQICGTINTIKCCDEVSRIQASEARWGWCEPAGISRCGSRF